MANWITHILLAEMLLQQGISLEKRGFCIGNIAPDCNIENADWSAFTPAREVTHWMTGANKQTADYEGFYHQHIATRKFLSSEEAAFCWGYYCHLVTDVLYQQFIRNPVRIASCFDRLKMASPFSSQITGKPGSFDTLKNLFGKDRVFQDIAILENNLVYDNPDCAYNQVLRKTTSFPDYLPFLPPNSITRKIPRMTYAVEKRFPEDHLLFFTKTDYQKFLSDTALSLYTLLQTKFN